MEGDDGPQWPWKVTALVNGRIRGKEILLSLCRRAHRDKTQCLCESSHNQRCRSDTSAVVTFLASKSFLCNKPMNGNTWTVCSSSHFKATFIFIFLTITRRLQTSTAVAVIYHRGYGFFNVSRSHFGQNVLWSFE